MWNTLVITTHATTAGGGGDNCVLHVVWRKEKCDGWKAYSIPLKVSWVESYNRDNSRRYNVLETELGVS